MLPEICPYIWLGEPNPDEQIASRHIFLSVS